MTVWLWNAAEDIALQPAPSGEQAARLDPGAARRWLATLATDPGNASAMRCFLHSCSCQIDLHRLSLDVLLDLLTAQIAAGRVTIEVHPRRTYGATRSPTTEPGRPAEMQATSANPRTHWIRIKVVSDEDGAPLPGVNLRVRLPDGVESDMVTRPDGTVEAHELPAGKCEASCDLTGARLASTLAFVRMGVAAAGRSGSSAPPAGASAGGDNEEGEEEDEGGSLSGDRIARVTAHKVKTGETIDSIARANGLTWQALSEFNWNTSVPEEINRHLRDEVGCTKKTADGHNYMFTSQDDPGILYVPTRWIERSLATDREHVVRVGRTSRRRPRPVEWEFSI